MVSVEQVAVPDERELYGASCYNATVEAYTGKKDSAPDESPSTKDVINTIRFNQNNPFWAPDGWKLVPLEPTPEMLWAEQCIISRDPADIYRAMLSAAPSEAKKDE